jgi:glycosyltransferase involved in cell wall biosynthesis
VVGLNLALQWSHDKQIEPVCSFPIPPGRIVLDPLRRRALTPFMRASAAFQDRLVPFAGQVFEASGPLLASMDKRFTMLPAEHDIRIAGQPTIAMAVFETAQFTPGDLACARSFPLIIAGSKWNEQVLAAHGISGVKTVHQGIDPALFHPAPAAGLMGGRFCVFSGGKLEFRKGQDIVLAAFARFARRHPEALLVAAWHSPWADYARSFQQSRILDAIPITPDGKVDLAGWVRAAGVSDEQFHDLGAIPNASLPGILREMDVAVFPNRCEGGTNLMAMECMACGVPVVLSANTGHLDLIDEDNCFPLREQAPLPDNRAGFADVPGWGESSISELADALEQAFGDRRDAIRRGRNGAATMTQMTWARTADQIKALILDMEPSVPTGNHRSAGPIQ